MTEQPEVIGQAVLRDYPLRLWAQQQEYTEEVLREFKLLLHGQASGQIAEAPAQLVALAEMFASRFGTLLDEITANRQAAYDGGADRMDSVVPLLAGVEPLLDQVAQVLEAVDDYCRRGDLLALARPPELVALFAWVRAELVAQAAGAEPNPWPGPF